jgi:hypothetical protein
MRHLRPRLPRPKSISIRRTRRLRTIDAEERRREISSMRVRAPLLALASLAAAGCATPQLSTPTPDRVDGAVVAARSAADGLQRELLAALTDAMAKTGPGGAITVCNEKAPQIAAAVSRSMSVDIGRTAQRIRNPANAPDAWEKDQLAYFATALASGKSAATLERFKVERGEDGWRVRWMRPIVLQPMCASCHGKDIDSGVGEILSALYPADQATGFEAGDLRGAFTASVAIRN